MDIKLVCCCENRGSTDNLRGHDGGTVKRDLKRRLYSDAVSGIPLGMLEMKSTALVPWACWFLNKSACVAQVE